MPQMMPLWWEMLMIFFIIMMMLFMILIYHYKGNKYNLKAMKMKNHIFNWKW